MMEKGLRVGCIGAGNAGTSHMIGLEKYAPGCCVAFSDIDRRIFDSMVSGYLDAAVRSDSKDLEVAPFELRPDFKDLPFYEDPGEMLEREDINTVIIASYCSNHAESVELCAKHKVNILLEKPVAIIEEDVDRVWRILKDYPRAATVNLSLRGSAVTESARGHIRNGSIGKIVSVQYVNNVHYGDMYFRKWMRTSKNAGSLLLQKATHDLDLINYFIDLKPVSVAAFGSRLVYGGDMPDELTCDGCERKANCPQSIYRRLRDRSLPLPGMDKRKCVYAREIDIDDNHVLIINYEDGVTVSYSQSMNAPARGGQRGGLFTGTEGQMDFRFYRDFFEKPGTGEEMNCNSGITIRKYNDKPGSEINEIHDWAGVGHFGSTENLKLGFLKLLNGEPSEMNASIKDGYISAKMCLAAQKSIETGSIVDIELDI